ncbi:50S ribosomal protein L30 [Buchnera aphidicola]|uniref:Large ribosomal subunit protein uL30 n=1 Tax=Buchnera aphidicola str. USDA (Myzus persicae) TaxID=1009856 RepID=W0NZH8_BUCMP|nr:50S ribosomal protein L30 [Buchnera aphidicola]AHG59896.1 Rpmd [Buchnera aphidicola str. USDA (Myzus persicae)]AHG60476.1 Rpmd [Buchnera aphidicola str. W106 (Myzus persicae)]AHG61049.1 Rpmd [Buchnera aphidicola str. G002 (Myzus persicae)]AHG61621.1 Rpmd [Buchnera aphidicola str. F009 (Myzus persicae)]WAI02866.1 MAG: 50S ribosomal protein L30 [Buchnera aphidicola (Myzus persicae)]
MKKIKITQIKSAIGRIPSHKKTLIGLGLRYIGHTVTRDNTDSIRGMVKKISYILKIQEE